MKSGFLLVGISHAIPAVVLMSLANAASADDRLEAGVRGCAAVTSETERLNCFDALAAAIATEIPGGRSPSAEIAEPVADVVAGEAAESAVAPVAASAPAAAAATQPPLTDDVGKPQSDGEGSYAATVTRCEENNATSRWYFYFDNGQVWRQSNAGRLRFRECAFDVTVTRDVFGYKMEIPSENETVRVLRVQ